MFNLLVLAPVVHSLQGESSKGALSLQRLDFEGYLLNKEKREG